LEGLVDKYQPVSFSANRQVRVTLSDISYADVFETGKVTNPTMLNSYQAAIAGSLALSSITTW